MSITRLFSKRQSESRCDVPEVYTYSELAPGFRAQVVMVLLEVFQNPSESNASFQAFATTVRLLRKEYGLFYLPPTKGNEPPHQELFNFFLNEKNIERALDVVEVCFAIGHEQLDGMSRSHDYGFVRRLAQGVEELNFRFKEHAIGYELRDGTIMRVDSQFIHAEVVKPALKLLQKKQFKGAQQEFLAAHDHYRHGKAKEALNECLKAFESTMKAICAKRGWQPKSQNANALIEVCFANGLIPQFWQSEFASLRSLLESGVPTGRNNLSGHGQGPMPTKVPDYMVRFLLHTTASAIVFLAEADETLT